MMKLCELLSVLGLASPELEITNIAQSTEKAAPDSLFVCIKGMAADGHELAPLAYEKGCRVFLAERPLDLPSDALTFIVPSTRLSLALLAAHWYGYPSKKLSVVGITGTKGKTTTAELLAKILNENSVPAGYIGTNGIHFADRHSPTANTTPEPMTLQKTLSDMVAAGMKAAVIEVSSQSLVQHRVDGTTFSALLFTNLFPDHIGVGEHPDFASYKAAKRRLFTEFEANAVIYNQDDPAAKEVIFPALAKRIVACSTERQSADAYAEEIRLTKQRGQPSVSMKIRMGDETVGTQLALPGEYNAKNALLAAATAKAIFGIPLSDSAKTLAHAKVAGRAEWFALSMGGYAVIDYAHNGESLRQLLLTLREYHPKRLVCLFGSVGGRTKLRRKELGAVAAHLSDEAYLTSDNPGEEDPMAILRDISAAFAGSKTPYHMIPDRREAILEAVKALSAGEILVLAGKGQEDYQLIGKEKIPFSEREILKEAETALPISN